MNSIKPLSQGINFSKLAQDLAKLLTSPENADIAVEFPMSFERYTGNLAKVENNLKVAAEASLRGMRQQFVAFAGDVAVGMSIIQVAEAGLDDINPNWPNVSTFICNPYRASGLGRLSMKTLLRVANEQFDGKAWTRVAKTNLPSKKLVEAAGFLESGLSDQHIFYTYDNRRI